MPSRTGPNQLQSGEGEPPKWAAPNLEQPAGNQRGHTAREDFVVPSMKAQIQKAATPEIPPQSTWSNLPSRQANLSSGVRPPFGIFYPVSTRVVGRQSCWKERALGN